MRPLTRRARALVSALLLASCTRASEPRKAGAAPVRVVFDQSLEQVSSPLDTSFEGMSELTRLLRRSGATATMSWAPLERALPALMARGGAPGAVVVLGIPWGREYSSRALSALDRFLRAGGGALVLTEHDDIYGNATAQNALTERYGIRTKAERAESREHGPDSASGRWVRVRFSASERDAQGARLYWPAPLAVSPPARALLEVREPKAPERSVVAATRKVGLGTLIVLGDLEVLWNMAPGTGMQLEDNRALALALFGSLAQRALDREPEPARIELSRGAPRARCATFVRKGDALHPGNAGDSLEPLTATLSAAGYPVREPHEQVDAACALVVAIAPLASFPAHRYLSAERFVLIGDGGTDLLRAEPALASSLALPGLEPREPPINALARPLGAALTRLTVIDPSDSLRAVATVGMETVALHRAATLEPIGSVRAVACAERTARTTGNLTPLHTAKQGEQPSLRSRPPRGASGEGGSTACQGAPLIAAASDRAFFVADLELVQETSASRDRPGAVLEALRDWLKP